MGQQSTAKPCIKVVAGILRRDGKILICQRAAGGRQELRWEFPGGKREPGEGEREALARELNEELGLRLRPEQIGRLVARLRHRYAEVEVELAFYEVSGWEGEPVNQIFAAMVWAQPEQLAGFDLLEADRPLLKLLD